MQQYQDKNVQILGVSFDTVEENAAFAKKFDFNFPLLSDTERAIGLAYGACDSADAQYASRISYLIDGAGRIVKAYPEVDVKAHPEEILKDV